MSRSFDIDQWSKVTTGYKERMTVKTRLAINGYGRIGRNILRAVFENNLQSTFDIVGINDLGDARTNAHLTQYDTVHGKFAGDVSLNGDDLLVNGDRFRVFAERDPAKLPWKDLEVDVVL